MLSEIYGHALIPELSRGSRPFFDDPAGIGGAWPVTGDIDATFYFRPNAGRIILDLYRRWLVPAVRTIAARACFRSRPLVALGKAIPDVAEDAPPASVPGEESLGNWSARIAIF